MMIHSFLLIGQSNMAGRGFLSEAHEIDGSNIRVLRNGRWQPFFRPVQPDRAFAGVSLAESFAEKYASEHGVTVGLIPCADGGTSLDQWKRGSLLFDNAVYCSRLALRTSNIAGVLWHQGESDSFGGKQHVYGEKLADIMQGLRRELSLEDVPFVLGGLGDYLINCRNGAFKDYFTVNEALKSYAEKTPMTGYAEASGLLPNPDNLHFSAASLYEFGLRYYEVFKTLENKNKIFADKPDDDTAVRGELEAL